MLHRNIAGLALRAALQHARRAAVVLHCNIASPGDAAVQHLLRGARDRP